MKITILCVGKLKEKYLKDAVAEYTKRLSRYATLTIEEVEDEKTPDGAGQSLEDQIRDREGARLLSRIPTGAHVIALVIEGKSLSSEEFSEMIAEKTVEGISHIVFVIGGSIGLSDSLIRQANDRISFSRMTFPHQLMRVILLEQIFRAFRIMRGEPYHK